MIMPFAWKPPISNRLCDGSTGLFSTGVFVRSLVCSGGWEYSLVELFELEDKFLCLGTSASCPHNGFIYLSRTYQRHFVLFARQCCTLRPSAEEPFLSLSTSHSQQHDASSLPRPAKGCRPKNCNSNPANHISFPQEARPTSHCARRRRAIRRSSLSPISQGTL